MKLNKVFPKVEIEGGELLEAPNGKQKKYKGKSHTKGGIDLQVGENAPLTDTTVPAGTKVFSKKTQIPNPETGKLEDSITRKKRREAENKKSYNSYNKIKKLFDSNPSSINKQTYNRQKQATEAVIARNQKEEQQDLDYMDMLSELEQFMYGGKIYPNGGKIYPRGGRIDFDPTDPPRKQEVFVDPNTGETVLKRGSSYFGSDKNFADDLYDHDPQTGVNFDAQGSDPNSHLRKKTGLNNTTFTPRYDRRDLDGLVPVEDSRTTYDPEEFHEKIEINPLDTATLNDRYGINIDIPAPESIPSGGDFDIKQLLANDPALPQAPQVRPTNVPAPQSISPLPFSPVTSNNTTRPTSSVPSREKDNLQPLPKLPIRNEPVVPPTIPDSNTAFDDAVGGTAQGDAEGLSRGDKLGLAGLGVAGAVPGLLTIINRAGDAPNVNPYEQYGIDALEANTNAQRSAATSAERNLEANTAAANTARAANRRGARSVNTLRNLDLAAFNAQQRATKGVIGQYENQISQLFAQRAGLENEQDRYYLKGEEDRITADKQDRDNFFSNLSANVVDAGSTLQQSGKVLNDLEYNQDFLDILPALNKHGYGFERNENGRLVLKSTNGN